MSLPLQDARKILVIVYGHMADTMAAIPALRSLDSACPSASIEVLALSSVRSVLEPCPHVDEFIGWSDFGRKGTRGSRVEKGARLASLGLRLRRRHYDATLVFHRSSGAMRKLASLIASPIRAGADVGGAGYTHPAPEGPSVGSSRDENRRVLQGLGIEEDGGPVELWTDPGDALWARNLIGNVPGCRVGIHAGSDWSCQQWLPEKFAEVGRTLQSRLGARIILTGSKSEVGLQEEVASGLLSEPVRTAGATSFPQLVEVVRNLDLLICVNSAAAAVARAVGTPSVILLGLEDSRYTGLEPGDLVRVIQPGAPPGEGGWCEFGRWGVLSGCNSPICRGLGGLSALSPDEVVTAATALLGAARSGEQSAALQRPARA
ncbi:MAG TPA: glycosyltransferase family 9 protein [Candidatus Acidoferrales bacterium]|nr:glycosyltransferase family 9 protein [Candidatus Acidoferrales bacterium]